MEVILRADVPNLGQRGHIVKVADGYARNYLFPRKLAMAATEGNKKVIVQEKAAAARRDASERGEAEELARQLAQVTITIARKTGQGDHLYGSVTSLDIADALAAKGFNVIRRKIHLEEPIRSLGEFDVPLRLHREVTATVKVWVVREE